MKNEIEESEIEQMLIEHHIEERDFHEIIES
ncbi:hypothetical protein AAUPMG_02218 [Pasteurella multocida subsp. multocida str. Anand1_goat]|nr:hypothetical protein AAUPMG_02218 [Pasteurella multocida subsp. multocida str. Anand1_goat]